MSFPGSGLRVLCGYQTLNTERPEHRRDLSVEALEARRLQRTSKLVAAQGRAKLWNQPLHSNVGEKRSQFLRGGFRHFCPSQKSDPQPGLPRPRRSVGSQPAFSCGVGRLIMDAVRVDSRYAGEPPKEYEPQP